MRGKNECGLPALAAPEPFTFKGESLEMYLCFRCKLKFRSQMAPFVKHARSVPIVRMKYYEDAHSNLWLSDLVRFYLQGVEGITVNRIGQMDRRHIELWYELTEHDSDLWAETNAKFERTVKINAGKAAVAAGDQETAKMHQEMVIALRAEREAEAITDGEESR